METCLAKLRAEGKIDDAREAKARRLYEDFRGRLGDEMGAEEAAARATADALDQMKRDAIEARRQALLQASRQKAILEQMKAYRTPSGKEDWGEAAKSHIDRDDAATFSNVEFRRRAILGQAHARMTDVLSTFRRDLFGRVRENARLDNLVREAFGHSTGDAAARELAHAWGEAAEMLRLRYNQAGGHIAKRADWGLPQSHDMLAVRKAGFDAWREFVLPRLAPEKMVDELTGRPLTRQQLEASLKSVYDTISTAGWSKVKASGVGSGTKLANRRAEARFLAFKDADAWLEYQGEFSAGSPFDVMLAHVDGMARDIAAMEIFGPNPTATLRWMEQTILKRGAELDAAAQSGKRGGALNNANKAVKAMRDMWAGYTGSANAPVDAVLARTMSGTRSVLTSALLGSASISATTDLAFQRQARMLSDLPVTKMIGSYLKLMSPTSKADQRLAVRSGLIAENWATIAMAQARYADEVSGPEFARRLADFTLRASLLSPWTQAGKWSFGMEFMGALADLRGKRFEALPKKLAKTLSQYGIGEGEWDRIRATKPYTHKGASFLRPDDVDDGELATRMLEMIHSQTELAVPSTSLRGRSLLMADVPAGTVPGELLRSVAQFKNFGVTLIFTHLRRGLMEKGPMAKASYLANLAIATTIMGGLSVQLKDMAKGKTPRDMSSPEFWGAAAAQGGGFGIYGDFLFSDVNRFGGGMAETIAGPVVSAANDVRRLTLGNAIELPGDKPTNAGREAIGMARKYTPGGSLWYVQLAYQRLILDQLQKEVDPEADRKFHEMEHRAKREMDQEFWWRPGEVRPN